jgi:hypothetical protein
MILVFYHDFHDCADIFLEVELAEELKRLVPMEGLPVPFIQIHLHGYSAWRSVI